MTLKKAGSIAEYAMRKWLQNQDLAPGQFSLTLNGRRGILTDPNGDTLTLVYDSDTRSVYAEDGPEVGI